MKHISKYISTISDLLCHHCSFLCEAENKKFNNKSLLYTAGQQWHFFKKSSLAVVTYLLNRLHKTQSFLKTQRMLVKMMERTKAKTSLS